MLLIVTAVLFLMSMPAHEASRFLHREEKNMMNKKHLLELLQGQVPQSSISQSHCLSFTTPSLSICTQSSHLYPCSKNQSKNRCEPQHCSSFARLTAEDSSASPHAQWADFHPLARSPDSTIS